MDKARLARTGGSAVARYIGFVCRNSRLVTDPAETARPIIANRPCIIAMWHGQFLLIPALAPPDVPYRVMVARHGDAEVIAETLAHFNMGLIRGAGAGSRQRDRGGMQALREALRALEQNYCVPMTADVPPGPARHCGKGIVTLARLSGRPVIPVAVATQRYRSLDTWSRMTINLPFGKLAALSGQPITVARDADVVGEEQARLAIETELNRLTKRAYELAGADPAQATPRDLLASGPETPGFGLKTYRTITGWAEPAAPAVLRYRERRGKEDARRHIERLGRPTAPRPDGLLVWLHAASVGETNAVLPLIEAMREQRPALRFLLTTGTLTSAELAHKRLSRTDVHQYIPLDGPSFVRNFLDYWHPDLAVLTESEIWPNLILETADRNIPIALVNARLSNRSYSRWKRRPGLSRPLFSRIDLVLAQNERLARRFRDIGARAAEPTGNLKIDAPPPPVDTEVLGELKTAIGDRPVFLAASTHEGEETIAAIAHKTVSRQVDGFCTIIVPRHPERGTGIAELLKGSGLSVRQRSLGALPDQNCDIYIADTIGELGTFYAFAPVVFIGGSLVPHGGHNPIEAIRRRVAVMTGPHWHNFRDAYRALLRHKGVVEVRDADEIAATVLRLHSDDVELARMQSGAEAALGTLSGALRRTADRLLGMLPNDLDLRRAS